LAVNFIFSEKINRDEGDKGDGKRKILEHKLY
jgi:hypothetical protein